MFINLAVCFPSLGSVVAFVSSDRMPWTRYKPHSRLVCATKTIHLFYILPHIISRGLSFYIFVHICIHILLLWLFHSCIHSFIHSFIRLFIHSVSQSSIYASTHPRIYLFIYLLTFLSKVFALKNY